MADIIITPASSIMSFTSSLNYTQTLTQEASGSLTLLGSGSTGRTDVFTVNGNNGTLFSVSDDLSNSLFSVNTIAGLPVIEAFANNTVVLGQYGQNVLVVTGSNVGIGTTSPNRKLDVLGGATFGSLQGAVEIGNSDYLGYISGHNGIAFSTNHLNVGLASGEKVRITAAGNVGIGTTSPYTKLQVSGTLAIGNGPQTGFAAAATMQIQESSNTQTCLSLWQSGVASNLIGSKPNDTNFYLTNDYDGTGLGVASKSLTIDTIGNVGIGITNPSAKLHVKSDASTGWIKLETTSGNPIIESLSGLSFTATGIATMFLANGGLSIGSGYANIYSPPSNGIIVQGNVGIGTTSPLAKLHVASSDLTNTPSGDIMLTRYSVSDTDVRGSSIFHYFDGTTDKIGFGVAGNGGSVSSPKAIAQLKMVVGADGNVGIGTTSPNAKLDVNGNTIITGSLAQGVAGNIASGHYSHAEGWGTVASGSYQHVQGQYNISSSAQSAFIIGNGTSASNRSNLIFAAGTQVQITGSLTGFVSASTITSTTASIDFSKSNFFTVALTNGANTHISASNISPGQTTSIRVTQGSLGTGTVTFTDTIKQISGSAYIASTVANAVDILSFVSFDSTSAYMVNVKNLI